MQLAIRHQILMAGVYEENFRLSTGIGGNINFITITGQTLKIIN
jgi:hypothetical protein